MLQGTSNRCVRGGSTDHERETAIFVRRRQPRERTARALFRKGVVYAQYRLLIVDVLVTIPREDVYTRIFNLV
jgi:hypothetical protein